MNLSNLTSLWKKYGAQVIERNTPPLLHANTRWPHRCWLDLGRLSCDGIDPIVLGHTNDNAWLEQVPESAVFPIWPMMIDKGDCHAGLFEPQGIETRLIEKDWACTFEQTAMYLSLEAGADYAPKAHPEFQVKTVRTPEDVAAWIDIGSEAFDYRIDRSVIETFINDEDVQLLLGCHNDQAIACALLYKTGDVIGVHQVGVMQAFQGKGVARRLMLNILSACALWQGRYVVLQASEAGKPLYDSLGFEAQFLIRNFQKVSLGL
jgi:GNAT superfamily N-acetyltransferase